tara:strand:- start:33 stop:311 length:279 start_codon:yes stop_codon:yes gene_type:complete
MIKLGNEMSFGANIEAQCLVSATPNNKRKFRIIKLHDRRLQAWEEVAKYQLQCFVCKNNQYKLVWTWATTLRRECIETKEMLVDAGMKLTQL